MKKHERIHTQEHHQLHKLSKATTSNDPDFNARYPTHRDDGRRISNEGLPHQHSPAFSLSPSSSAQDPLSPNDQHYLGLPPAHGFTTPSPLAIAALHKKQHEELAAYQQRELLALQQLAYQQQQSSALAAQLQSEALGKSMKRGPEDAFDNFVEDMKRRKMDPVYDVDMISRLNALMPPGLPAAYNLSSLGGGNPGLPSNISPFSYPSLPNLGNHAQNQSVPPIQIPEIRTEADLAMFNQFMVSLGREAAGGASLPMEHVTSSSATSASGGSRNSLSPLSAAENSPIEDLFNPSELASLGLAGMPGIPNSTPSPNGSVSLGSLYPSLDGLDGSRPRASSVNELQQSRRPIAGLPRAGSHSASKMNGALYGGVSASQYPQVPEWTVSHASNGPEHNYASFDSLGARSRSSVPAATLAPRDFYKRTYRHIAPLGAAPHRESGERSTAADDDDESDVSSDDTAGPRIPVDALCVGDSSLKLPAIGSGHEDNGTQLPSLRSLRARPISPARNPPIKRHTDEQIIHGVKRLELDDRRRGDSPASSLDGSESSRPSTATPTVEDMRRRHAALIRAWLVAVNLEFKRKQVAETCRERERERTPTSTAPMVTA